MKVRALLKEQKDLLNFSEEVILSFESARKMAKLIQKINEITEPFIIQFQELEYKYGQKNENNELLKTTDGSCPLIPGKEEEYSNIVNPILDKEINFTISPIFTNKDFRNINIRPTMVLMLMNYKLLD